MFLIVFGAALCPFLWDSRSELHHHLLRVANQPFSFDSLRPLLFFSVLLSHLRCWNRRAVVPLTFPSDPILFTSQLWNPFPLFEKRNQHFWEKNFCNSTLGQPPFFLPPPPLFPPPPGLSRGVSRCLNTFSLPFQSLLPAQLWSNTYLFVFVVEL